MFRGLRDAFDRKKRILEKYAHTQKKVLEVIQEFGRPNSITYDPDQGVVKIETGSKTLASELVLRSGEISSLLRAQGITVKQLVIR